MHPYKSFLQALPKSAADIGCFILCFIFIPITFIFEFLIVLPEFHDTGGTIYIWLCALATFYMFNLVGNMLCCMFVETSTRGIVLQPPKNPHLKRSWRFCVTCESLMPPRSWHCKVCKTCILKRDHHCWFTGCCVGHRNYRFFLLFMIYIAIGSTISTIYNSFYMWYLHAEIFANAHMLIKIFMPMLMFAMDMSWTTFYLLIYDLNVIAACYSTVLILYHLPGLLVGAVTHEAGTKKYDLGLRRNLEMVLGTRMHLVWLSPFIDSPLPHDGINWDTLARRNPKNR